MVTLQLLVPYLFCVLVTFFCPSKDSFVTLCAEKLFLLPSVFKTASGSLLIIALFLFMFKYLVLGRSRLGSGKLRHYTFCTLLLRPISKPQYGNKTNVCENLYVKGQGFFFLATGSLFSGAFYYL